MELCDGIYYPNQGGVTVGWMKDLEVTLALAACAAFSLDPDSV